jgi:WD40 repeat protein
VKECLPEFFYFAAFLRNDNKFDLGRKQTGERVDSVRLPPWAQGSAPLFVARMREALESEYVSQHLPAWIDLIFGCKQRGEEARVAMNLFHPLTYEGAVDVDSLTDPVERAAVIAQINSYGQVPKQLFTKPHPPRLQQPQVPALLKEPSQLRAAVLFRTPRSVGSLALVHNSPVVLSPAQELLLPEADSYLSWGEWDRTLRVRSLSTGRVIVELDQVQDEVLLCAHTARSLGVVAFGGQDRNVQLWYWYKEDWSNKNTTSSHLVLEPARKLHGHDGAVLCVHVCQEFGVVCSGSADCSCIIWDLNRLRFIRSIALSLPVEVVTVSPVTCEVFLATKKQAYLYTINGELLGSVALQTHTITHAVFTTGMQGAMPQYVLAGTATGHLLVFNTLQFALVHVIAGATTASIVCLALDELSTQLYSSSADGAVCRWSCDKSAVEFSDSLGI